MANIIIRCPRTGINVQLSLAKDASAYQVGTYESVTCPTCQRLHFINKTAGKFSGERESRPRGRLNIRSKSLEGDQAARESQRGWCLSMEHTPVGG